MRKWLGYVILDREGLLIRVATEYPDDDERMIDAGWQIVPAEITTKPKSK